MGAIPCYSCNEGIFEYTGPDKGYNSFSRIMTCTKCGFETTIEKMFQHFNPEIKIPQEEIGLPNDPEIKVIKINDRWHARLFLQGKVIDEMACNCSEDIGLICKEMLRWYDKLGGDSKYASDARHRESTVRPIIGKIWYQGDLEKEKQEKQERQQKKRANLTFNIELYNHMHSEYVEVLKNNYSKQLIIDFSLHLYKYAKNVLRYGQIVFNVVYDVFPDLTNRLRGTDIDCFHNDKTVDSFLNAIDKLLQK